MIAFALLPQTSTRAGCRRLVLIAALSFATASVRAQDVGAFFPSGNSGYDQELGVTVLTRLRPLFEPQGVRVGSFTVSPTFDQTLEANSNVTGNSGSGAFGSLTSGGVSVNSDWPRDSLGANAGVSQQVYTTNPSISYTNWNVGLGGGYTIDRNQLTVDYSHQAYNQLGTSIGTVTSTTPILDQTDSVNAAYSFQFGDLSVTPDLSASAYRFGNATVGGQTIDQSFLDNNVLAGSLTGRFSLDQEGSLIVIAQGVGSDYSTRLFGQPDQSSRSVLVLAGIDYQAKGLFRYQLLAGVERRDFVASQYEPRTAPIAQGNVIWSPTALTTVTGTLSREIDGPQSGGTNGFVLTDLRLSAAHEFLPNLFGDVSGDFDAAQYLQGGSQTAYTLGAGLDWLLNRRLRLSFGLQYTQQSGSFRPTSDLGPQSTVTNAYIQDLASVTLHVAL